jgi:hypothetical protein
VPPSGSTDVAFKPSLYQRQSPPSGNAILRGRDRLDSSESQRRPAMPARRFERIALALLLAVGCVVFGHRGLIEHAQAQPGYVPPPTPLPPPVLNPSSPNTVPQPTPSTTPSIPSTVPSGEATSPVNEEPPTTTARSERTSFAKTRSVRHHHRGRHSAEPTLGSFYCGYYGWCVRISPPYTYYQR